MKADHILTSDEAQAYQAGWREAGLLPIWTVYSHPNDYPLNFVARPGLVGKIAEREGLAHTVHAVLVAATHAELIELLPMGLLQMPRQPMDEPHILETWF